MKNGLTKGEKLRLFRGTSIYVFSPKLCWTKIQKILALQANKGKNTIFRCQRYFGHLYHKELFKLFHSTVTPILTYSAEIWGYNPCPIIEQIHIRF
jgi:hypothetical protein